MGGPMQQRKTIRTRLWKLFFRIEKKFNLPQHSLVSRIRSSIYDYRQWWQWGRVVMDLVGRADCGNYSPPEPRAWYWTWVNDPERKYRPKKRHDHGQFLLVCKSYEEYKNWNTIFDAERLVYQEWYKTLSEDERRSALFGKEMRRRHTEPYWHHFNVQDDGAVLIPGNVYEGEGGRNYGLSRKEADVLRKYLRHWRINNWFGLRSWLYYKGLHNAVEGCNPRLCGVVPDQGSGGYRHWHCQLRKKHEGPHRYNNYIWPGPGTRVEYVGDKNEVGI